MEKVPSVQVFGRKVCWRVSPSDMLCLLRLGNRDTHTEIALYEQKNAVAVAYCKRGAGLIKINGSPIELVEPAGLRIKTYEPILLLGKDKFANVDIRVRVKGGGYTAQIYAIRQAIAKSLVAYYQKCELRMFP